MIDRVRGESSTWTRVRARGDWGRAALVGVLAALLSITLLWPSHGFPFGWDEVDYVNAARLGAGANYLEQGSLSPGEYLSFATAKWAKLPPSFPGGYEESTDPFLLRHYHPPFVVYLLAAVIDAPGERVARSVQLLGVLALTGLLLIAYIHLTPRASWLGALVVGLSAIWASHILFTQISFHGWMAVWTTASALAALRWWRARRRRDAVATCLCVALALATLETGIILLLGAVCTELALRHRSRLDSRLGGPPIWAGAGVVLAATFALWPGALLKISILKIVALNLYRVARGDEYASVGERLAEMFSLSLAPGLILVLLVVLWTVRQRDLAFGCGVFAGLGALYTLCLARFALFPTYLMPGLLLFVPVAGALLDGPAAPWLRWTSVLAVVASLGMSTVALRGGAEGGATIREDLAWLEQHVGTRELLADGGHIYRFYLNKATRIRDIVVNYDEQTLAERRSGTYQPIRAADLTGGVLLVQHWHRGFLTGGGHHLVSGCERIDRSSFVAFDCGTVLPRTAPPAGAAVIPRPR